MTLIASKKKPVYRWQKGDLIGSREAAEICGYKSAKQFQDAERRSTLGFDFTVIWQGGRMFFLRSEIDEYLTGLVEMSQKLKNRRNKNLRF